MMRLVNNSFLVFLAILSVSPVLAGPRYARVVVGSREAMLSPRAVVENGAVYAPVDLLKRLDANFAQGKSKVTMVLDEGAAELDITERQGTPMVRLDEAAKALDVEYLWDDATSTARIMARLVSVEFEDSTMIIRSTLPVAVQSHRLWKDPWRISLDITGARIASGTRRLPVEGTDVNSIRIGQFKEDVARVVVDLDSRKNYRLLTESTSREIRVAIGGSFAPSPRPAAARPKPEPAIGDSIGNNGETAAQPKPEPAPAQPATPVNISAVKIEPDGDSKVTVKIATDGRAGFKTTLLTSPLRVALDIKNAVLPEKLEDLSSDHAVLKSVRAEKMQNGDVRVVMDINRYAWFDAAATENEIALNMRLPSGAGGRLSEKTVVLDPGHGGKDPGAHSGDTLEKTINLLMAQRIKTALEEAGARVILTRSDDRFIELAARPAVADSHSADFFISLHCNALIPEARTGVETYYHPGQPSSKSLALAVHDRIIKRTDMKDNGAKLDTRLYKSGLAVLRKANVPAILIECGYIDCSIDRGKLCDDSYRGKLAEAVVEGLRQYVEGTIDSEDTDNGQ